ncbi:MAG: hypothetical protein MUE60_03100 [Candidatus Eisenbacteria bacterium]|jgi:hypothetical protein|nr:hypothetical protein [Candidatus Eisenbacteria bacterium]
MRKLDARKGFTMRNGLTFTLALLLIGVVGVAIPLHHHADGESHDDCPVCALQAVAAVPAIAPALAAATICQLISALLPAPLLRTLPLALYEARAPPLLPV